VFGYQLVAANIVSAVVPMRRELKDAFTSSRSSAAKVSAVVPMRRELKVGLYDKAARSDIGFSSCPDEEGTESSRSREGVGLKKKSFSSCPDEEGTERRACATSVRLAVGVSAVVPMRRELKVSEARQKREEVKQFQQLSR